MCGNEVENLGGNEVENLGGNEVENLGGNVLAIKWPPLLFYPHVFLEFTRGLLT